MLQFECPAGHRYGIAGHGEDMTRGIVREGSSDTCPICRAPKEVKHAARADQILRLICRGLAAGAVPSSELIGPLGRAQAHLYRQAELAGWSVFVAPEWFKAALDEDAERPLETLGPADCISRLVRAVAQHG